MIEPVQTIGGQPIIKTMLARTITEDAFIEWLIDIGYPFDMTFDPAPPVDLDRLALRWKARDHWDDVSDEDAIDCIRAEAGA